MTALQPPARIEFVRALGAEWPISYSAEETHDGAYAFLDMVRLNDVWFYAVDVLSDDLFSAIETALNNPQEDD